MKGITNYIDFKGIKVASGSTGATIAGIHDAIKNAIGATQVVGLLDNTTAIAPFYAVFVPDGTSYTCELVGYGRTMTVTNADKVTIADNA